MEFNPLGPVDMEWTGRQQVAGGAADYFDPMSFLEDGSPIIQLPAASDPRQTDDEIHRLAKERFQKAQVYIKDFIAHKKSPKDLLKDCKAMEVFLLALQQRTEGCYFKETELERMHGWVINRFKGKNEKEIYTHLQLGLGENNNLRIVRVRLFDISPVAREYELGHILNELLHIPFPDGSNAVFQKILETLFQEFCGRINDQKPMKPCSNHDAATYLINFCLTLQLLDISIIEPLLLDYLETATFDEMIQIYALLLYAKINSEPVFESLSERLQVFTSEINFCNKNTIIINVPYSANTLEFIRRTGFGITSILFQDGDGPSVGSKRGSEEPGIARKRQKTSGDPLAVHSRDIPHLERPFYDIRELINLLPSVFEINLCQYFSLNDRDFEYLLGKNIAKIQLSPARNQLTRESYSLLSNWQGTLVFNFADVNESNYKKVQELRDLFATLPIPVHVNIEIECCSHLPLNEIVSFCESGKVSFVYLEGYQEIRDDQMKKFIRNIRSGISISHYCAVQEFVGIEYNNCKVRVTTTPTEASPLNPMLACALAKVMEHENFHNRALLDLTTREYFYYHAPFPQDGSRYNELYFSVLERLEDSLFFNPKMVTNLLRLFAYFDSHPEAIQNHLNLAIKALRFISEDSIFANEAVDPKQFLPLRNVLVRIFEFGKGHVLNGIALLRVLNLAPTEYPEVVRTALTQIVKSYKMIHSDFIPLIFESFLCRMTPEFIDPISTFFTVQAELIIKRDSKYSSLQRSSHHWVLFHFGNKQNKTLHDFYGSFPGLNRNIKNKYYKELSRVLLHFNQQRTKIRNNFLEYLKELLKLGEDPDLRDFFASDQGKHEVIKNIQDFIQQDEEWRAALTERAILVPLAICQNCIEPNDAIEQLFGQVMHTIAKNPGNFYPHLPYVEYFIAEAVKRCEQWDPDKQNILWNILIVLFEHSVRIKVNFNPFIASFFLSRFAKDALGARRAINLGAAVINDLFEALPNDLDQPQQEKCLKVCTMFNDTLPKGLKHLVNPHSDSNKILKRGLLIHLVKNNLLAKNNIHLTHDMFKALLKDPSMLSDNINEAKTLLEILMDNGVIPELVDMEINSSLFTAIIHGLAGNLRLMNSRERQNSLCSLMRAYPSETLEDSDRQKLMDVLDHALVFTQEANEVRNKLISQVDVRLGVDLLDFASRTLQESKPLRNQCACEFLVAEIAKFPELSDEIQNDLSRISEALIKCDVRLGVGSIAHLPRFFSRFIQVIQSSRDYEAMLRVWRTALRQFIQHPTEQDHFLGLFLKFAPALNLPQVNKIVDELTAIERDSMDAEKLCYFARALLLAILSTGNNKLLYKMPTLALHLAYVLSRRYLLEAEQDLCARVIGDIFSNPSLWQIELPKDLCSDNVHFIRKLLEKCISALDPESLIMVPNRGNQFFIELTKLVIRSPVKDECKPLIETLAERVLQHPTENAEGLSQMMSSLTIEL